MQVFYTEYEDFLKIIEGDELYYEFAQNYLADIKKNTTNTKNLRNEDTRKSRSAAHAHQVLQNSNKPSIVAELTKLAIDCSTRTTFSGEPKPKGLTSFDCFHSFLKKNMDVSVKNAKIKFKQLSEDHKIQHENSVC